jgi:predicted RND superfamily exporter protein
MRGRLFRFIAGLTCRHPWKIIILSLVVFAAAAGFASTIVPKLTWLDLLPEDAPSVKEFSRILDQYGSSETIIAAIEGDDRRELVDFAESFKSRIIDMKDSEGDRLIKHVHFREDADFIRRHGLMLVKAKDLERMLSSGMFDAPGLGHAVDSYNRDFKREYVDEGGESLQKKENDASAAVRTMWHLPSALRRFLENADRPDEELRPVVEAGAEKFVTGDTLFLSDDGRILLIIIQPVYPSNDTFKGLTTVQRLIAIFEEELGKHQAIAKHYAGPWPETLEWKVLYPRVKDDPAAVEKLRTQIAKEAPHIAPEGRLDSGTGMTGMHVYMNDEYATMMHDMKGTNVLAFVIVFVLFVLAFRMWSSPLLAMWVLVLGITAGVALVAVLLGELNMMSMMFPVILIGLGIDYSIHIISGFTQLRNAGRGIHEAMAETLRKTGKGILTGALTTAVAFAALALSSFKGLRHLGIGAGLGVICTLAASFLFLPPLLVVLHRWKERRSLARRIRRGETSGEEVQQKKFMLEFRSLTWIGTRAYLGWPVTLAVVAAVSLYFGLRAERVHMAKNMLDIEAKHLASIELNHVLEKRFFMHSDASFVTARSLEESDRIREKMEELDAVAMVDSISIYLPPPDKQKERAPLIDEIRGRIDAWDPPENFDAESTSNFIKALKQMDCNVISMKKMAFIGGMDRLYGLTARLVPEGSACVLREEGKPRPAGGWPRIAASEEVKTIEKLLLKAGGGAPALLDRFQSMFEPKRRKTMLGMADPSIVALEDLPVNIRERYVSRDGKHFLLTVYPRHDIWDEDFQKRFMPQAKSVTERVTGVSFLFVDTVERGAREGKRATLIAFIAIFLLLLLDFSGMKLKAAGIRSGLTASVLAVLPLAAAALWMVGFMNILHVDINMVNIIAVPLILGIGIDDAVHIIHRYRIEGGGGKIDKVFSTTGRAILLTSLTTIAAFGSFLFSLYRGLSTTGIILSIGIAVCFVTSVCFLPALLRLAEKFNLDIGKEVDDDTPGT